MARVLDPVKWLIRNYPPVFVAICTIVAGLLVKLGLNIDGSVLAGIVAAALGVSLATIPLVTPEPKAKARVEQALYTPVPVGPGGVNEGPPISRV